MNLVGTLNHVVKRRGKWSPRRMKQAPSIVESCKTIGNCLWCESWNYIMWHFYSWLLFSCLLWGQRLFIVDGVYYVVRCPPWLYFLWYGYFSVGTLMVVCQAMELDGDKKVQLVQMLGTKLTRFFFLCISINNVLLWILGVDCIL